MKAERSESDSGEQDFEEEQPLKLFDSRLRAGKQDVASGVALGGLIGVCLAVPAAVVLARPPDFPILASALLGVFSGALVGGFFGRAITLVLQKRIEPERRGTALQRLAPVFGIMLLMWAGRLFIVSPATHGRRVSILCFTMYVACAIPTFVRYLGIYGVGAVSVALAVGLSAAVLSTGRYADLSVVGWPAMIAFISFLAARRGIQVTYNGRIIRGEKRGESRKAGEAQNSAAILQTIR